MNRIVNEVKKYVQQVDWNLFVFLLLFMHVKLIVKLVALFFIYARRFDFSFRFSFKKSRLPLFYLSLIAIACINFFLYGLFRNNHYLLLFCMGLVIWVVCILAQHQVKLRVEKMSVEKIHGAISLFFLVNAAISFINLGLIMLDSGAVNPYLYQGNFQQYFIGTGDFIRGASFDTSTTNAILNAFGIMYFLLRNHFGRSLLCMAVLLLTCSNFTNMLVIGCLLFMFLYRTNRNQKSIIVVQVLMLVLFMAKISPHNNTYALKIAQEFFGKYSVRAKPPVIEIPITEREDSTLTAEEKKYKYAKRHLDSVQSAKEPSLVIVAEKQQQAMVPAKVEIPKENIHAPDHQHKQDSSATRLQAIALLEKEQQANKADTISKKLPGKAIAFIQLFQFYTNNPSRIFTGDGLGNFSSKMAFRASGLQIAGSYPASRIYISDEFKKNHFLVYLSYFSTDSVYHSIANSPNSVYAQLLGEYGLAGVACFLFLYLWYFGKKIGKLTYGLPVLLIMLGSFLSDYWFEQLSVVVFFELLMFLDRKEQLGEEPAV